MSRHLKKDTLCDTELTAINDLANQWRERLGDIRWIMKTLIASIVRKANAK